MIGNIAGMGTKKIKKQFRTTELTDINLKKLSDLYEMSETDILNSLIYEKSKILDFVEQCINKLEQNTTQYEETIWGGNKPKVRIYIQPEYIGVYPIINENNQYINLNSWTRSFVEIEYSTNPNFKYFLTIKREFQQENQPTTQYYLQNIFTNNLFEEFDKLKFTKETWHIDLN